MAEESAAAGAEAAAKSGMLLVVGLVVLGAGGAGAAWYLGLLPGRKAEAKEEVRQAAKPAVGALLALEPS